MVLCKFWARGDCKNGDQCRFDHPPRDGALRNDNRFTALQTQNSSSSTPFGRPQNDSSARGVYNISKDAITGDLTIERPQWILSAYAPGLKAPTQLFGGPDREQSFEEVRMRHYEAQALGNPALAVRYEDELFRNAGQQIQNALNNVDGALEYVLRAANEHPNRNDICNAASAQGNIPGEFGQKPATSFSASSNQNQQPVQANNTFGKPAVLGQRQNPFGVPGSMVGAQLSHESTPFAGAGGRPNPFGQPSQPFQAPPNPFAPTTRATAVNPFAQPVQQAPANPFAAKPTAVLNPFSSTTVPPVANSSNHQQSEHSAPNPFASTPSVQRAANPFAPNSASTVFGVPTNTTETNHHSPGVQSFPQPSTDLFRRHPGTSAETSNAFNPFAPRLESSTNAQLPPPVASANNIRERPGISSNAGSPYPPGATFQHPSLQSYASQDADKKLSMFKGKPVVYQGEDAGFRNRDGLWEKIWFPEGAPSYNKDTELPDDAYDDATKSAYLHLREHGSFEGLIMPLIPPKREWCLWDF